MLVRRRAQDFERIRCGSTRSDEQRIGDGDVASRSREMPPARARCWCETDIRWPVAYLTSVGAARTSRVKRWAASVASEFAESPSRPSSLATKACAACAFKFQAGPVAASPRKTRCRGCAHLGRGMREQARDLGFERAGAHDLAERCICGKRKQVAGDIESPRLERTLVRLRLQGLRAGDATAK